MKFSDLLGEPEPERESELTTEPEPERAVIPAEPWVSEPRMEEPRIEEARRDEPIAVFAPVPAPPLVAPTPEPQPAPPLPQVRPGPALDQPLPAPPLGGRSGLAELNIRQEAAPVAPPASSVLDQLAGLDAVVDDLLPSARHRNRK